MCSSDLLLEDGLIDVFHLPIDTLRAAPTQFYTMLLYGLFFSFAANLVLYLGSMSSLDQSVMEYGEIDGLVRSENSGTLYCRRFGRRLRCLSYRAWRGFSSIKAQPIRSSIFGLSMKRIHWDIGCS